MKIPIFPNCPGYVQCGQQFNLYYYFNRIFESWFGSFLVLPVWTGPHGQNTSSRFVGICPSFLCCGDRKNRREPQIGSICFAQKAYSHWRRIAANFNCNFSTQCGMNSNSWPVWPFWKSRTLLLGMPPPPPPQKKRKNILLVTPVSMNHDCRVHKGTGRQLAVVCVS